MSQERKIDILASKVESPGFTPPRQERTVHSPMTARRVEDLPIDFSRLFSILYNDLEQQITRIDGKAQLVLSTNAILAAVVGGVGIRETLSQNSLSNSEVFLALSYLAYFVLLLISVLYSLWAAFPQLNTPPNPLLKNKINLYNPVLIAQMQAADYQNYFLEMRAEDLKVYIINQIHAKAAIVNAKAHRLRTSLNFLMVSLVVLMFGQFIQVFTQLIGSL
jgi:hypothetical protein